MLDQAQSVRSREIVAALGETHVMNFRYRLATPQQLDELMRTGRISAALVIPADFERRLATRDRVPMQIVVDGSDQVTQQAARQLAALPLAGVIDPGGAANPNQTAGNVEIVNFYNPERLAPVNTVPGLIGVILTMTMVLFTAMAIVRERERGNLELLITTPIRSWELMAGKLLPYVLIGLVQTTLVLVLGALLFDVPVNGRLTDLYAAAALFIAATLTLGLLISTFAKTQFQAFQLAFATMLPSILLSGFMFPFDGMPRFAQWLAQALPLTHFVVMVRGIILRGAPLADLRDCWEQMQEIDNFDILPTDGEYFRCALRPRNGLDLRPLIFALARDRAWSLRELTRNRHSLEDIYVRVTRPEEEEEG